MLFENVCHSIVSFNKECRHFPFGACISILLIPSALCIGESRDLIELYPIEIMTQFMVLVTCEYVEMIVLRPSMLEFHGKYRSEFDRLYHIPVIEHHSCVSICDVFPVIGRAVEGYSLLVPVEHV